MTFRAATDSNACLASSASVTRDRSATWPAASELSNISIEPGPPGAGAGSPVSGIPDLSEFFAPDDHDTLKVFTEPDRHDTMPSPPPEFESAPFHEQLVGPGRLPR
jgi:hypothetical protein